MSKFLLLTMAVLIFLLCADADAQPTLQGEVIWESTTSVGFNDLKFSPDDKYFYIRNDNGIHKFDSENGHYMGIFIAGLTDDFGIISEYGWMFCTRAEGLSIYDMNTGEFIRNIGDSWPGGWFDVSPDKSKIVFRQQGSMWVYSLPDLQEICRFQHNGSPRFLNNDQIAMTRSDSAMGGGNWAVDIYSVQQQMIIKKLPIPHPANSGDAMYVSSDYKNIITINSTEVNFYDSEKGELINKIPFHQAYIFGFNPTGQYYNISGSIQNSIYNFKNHKEIFSLNPDDIRAVRFLNLNNKRLISIHKFGILKMLRFDFDSLATGVEIKDDIPVIYPNPTMNFVNIPIENEFITKVVIRDYTGKEFPTDYLIESNKKLAVLRLNLTTLPKGTYIITIQSGKENKTYKLMKGE